MSGFASLLSELAQHGHGHGSGHPGPVCMCAVAAVAQSMITVSCLLRAGCGNHGGHRSCVQPSVSFVSVIVIVGRMQAGRLLS